MALEKPASARAVALDLTRAVLDRRQALDQALESHTGLRDLSPRDRAFARLLVTTVLRRLGQIDAALARCLERPLPRKAEAARAILQIGAAQLLFIRTPAHAAVDSMVGLASAAAPPYRALVNAVLRRLAREGDGLLAEQDAARLNLPAWLWQSWGDAYGEANVRAIAAVLATEPPLDLSVKADDASWAERLQASRLFTGTLRRAQSGPVTELPGYVEGAWWVQDAAASLPARLFGSVRGQTVLDLCAAPGGKTAQLAAMGARVIAIDRAAPRMERLKANLARLGLSAETVVGDAETWRPPQPVPFVLLDAPCSATGTLRRHPDVAWLKSPDDVARLTAAQDRLLEAAIAMLAPGGTLVYCTCSLQPDEGPARVAALLGRGAPVSRRPIAPAELDDMDALLTPDGDLRTLPCHLADRGGLDGFYAVRLVRAS